MSRVRVLVAVVALLLAGNAALGPTPVDSFGCFGSLFGSRFWSSNRQSGSRVAADSGQHSPEVATFQQSSTTRAPMSNPIGPASAESQQQQQQRGQSANVWPEERPDELMLIRRDSSTSKSESSTPQEEQNGDYDARCFVEREPSFKDNPKLFFFSSKNHSNATRGCSVELQIQLGEPEDPKAEGSSKRAANNETSFVAEYNETRARLIESGLYKGEYPTFIITHGFLSSWNGDNWMCRTKDFILDQSKANVFIVDWSGGAKPMLPIDYGAAVTNTKYVAQMIGDFINQQLLPLSGQKDGGNFHLIGHSLGAHISGFIGYSVNGTGHITGLDPAGPCFTSNSKQQERVASQSGELKDDTRRLSPESANFVLALHTDTALFGLNENCGHYDVYVNGGYKQPNCGSTLASRARNLFELNFKDSFNPDIACAHSYVQTLLDTLVDFVGEEPKDGGKGSSGKEKARALLKSQAAEDHSQRCYPMAFQCRGWAAFRAGECGFCLDDDPHCVYAGLSLYGRQALRSSANESGQPIVEEEDADPSECDDNKFNDEEGDGDNPDESKPPNPNDGVPSDKFSRGQNFMKAGSKSSTCLYHYQVIVASRKSQVEELSNSTQKQFYYLHIPLQPEGMLNSPQGDRLHDRLIQVSHRIKPGSSAHNYIKSTFMAQLREQNPRLQMGQQGGGDDDCEFYSALVTFRQAPEEQCRGGDTDGSAESKKWQLCKPLDSIKEARLWSKNETKLEAVEWVGMNYMSGLRLQDRVSNSWLFDKDLKEGVKSRHQLGEPSAAQIGDLTSDHSKSAGNIIKKPIACFLSLFDSSESGKASRNFKCNRSAEELKFSIKLNPSKQARSAAS